jgi:diguanylate cyclase (GGDEF)-like protein/PAS domain S-box-containing protein
MSRIHAFRHLAVPIAFGLGYAVLAACSLMLTTNLHSHAYPWPADAIFLALLCRVPVAKRVAPLVAIFIAMTAVTQWMHNVSPFIALGFGVLVVLQIGIGSWLITEFLKIDFRKVTTIEAVRGFLLAGVLAALPSSLVFAAVGVAGVGMEFMPALLQRWRDSVLMFVIFAPPVLFYSNEGMRRLWRPKYRLENLAHPLVMAVLVYFSLHYISFPFVTMMVPLLVAAYRQGPLGAALCGLLVTTEVILLWVTRSVPPLAASIGDDALASLPLFAIASMVLAPIALSLGVVERRAAMRSLRISERETMEIIEESPAGMGVFPYLSAGGYLNDAFLRMLGRESERGTLIEARTFMDEAELQADRLTGADVVAGKLDLVQGRRRYYRRDGSMLWVQVRISLNRNADGSPRRWLLQAENIDERVKAERQQQAERERLRNTLESVGDGVLTIDLMGTVTFANPAILETLGQPAASVLGQPLEQVLTLTSIQSGKTVPSMLAMAELAGEAAARTEAVVLHAPDGRVCYIRETVSPLQLEHGVVSGWVVAIHDVTESLQRELEARERADHDAVTGLANRHSFMARVEKEFGRAQMLGTSAYVIAIDLDHFKAVNDTGGHAAGDKMLCAVGEAIVATVRSHDLVARIGGDEFAVVLDRCDSKTADEVAARLVAAIKGSTIEHDGVTHGVGASVGVAAANAKYASAAQWIAGADAACYDAKRAGRGRVGRAA